MDGYKAPFVDRSALHAVNERACRRLPQLLVTLDNLLGANSLFLVSWVQPFPVRPLDIDNSFGIDLDLPALMGEVCDQQKRRF